MTNQKNLEDKRVIITKEQAIEIADKYLFLYCGKTALKDNISATKGAKGWAILAITTPIISGQETYIENFEIDMETGEVGVVISSIALDNRINEVLKLIRDRKDIDEAKKAEISTKVEEVKNSVKRKDKEKIIELKKWFEKNTPFFKSILDLINTILTIYSKFK
jgi:hypothetical protein